MAVVGYFYFFENHPHYLETLEFLPRIITGLAGFAITIGIILGIQVAWNHFKKRPILEFKLSAWKGLAILLVITLGLLTTTQIDSNLAIYNGGTLIQEDGNWGMLPENMEPTESMTVVLEDDTIIADDNFIEIFPAEIQANFTKVSLIKAAALTGWRIIINLAALLLIALSGFAIGHRILRFTKIGKSWESKPREPSEFLLSVGVGLSVLMALIFALGMLGIARIEMVLGGIVVLTAIGWKDTLGLVKATIKNSLDIKLDFRSLSLWTALGTILILGYNILSIIRPMPIGWDDAKQYLFMPEKIAQTEKLLENAGGMYNWELINTIGAYTGNAMLPLFINFGGGLLALGALYMVLKIFMRKEMALMMTSLFYVMPTVIFQSSIDLKNDLALTFFVLLAIYAFIKWFQGPSEKCGFETKFTPICAKEAKREEGVSSDTSTSLPVRQAGDEPPAAKLDKLQSEVHFSESPKDAKNSSSWLYLTGILIGVSLGIKITAGIALIVLMVLIGIKLLGKKGGISIGMLTIGILLMKLGGGTIFNIPIETIITTGEILTLGGIVLGVFSLRKRIPDKKILKTIGVFFTIILLSVAPWFVKNTIIDGLAINIGNYYATNANNVMDVDLEFMDDCERESFSNEYDDYVTGRGESESETSFLSLLKMPWQMTMNPGFEGIYVDMTFVFLAILPLFIFYLTEKKDKTFNLIATVSGLYFITLIFFLFGVIWYGYVGICGLLILIGRLTENYDKESWQGNKILSLIPKTAISITIITITFVQIASFSSMDGLAYLGGIIDDEDYISVVNPGVLKTVEILEQDEDLEGTHIYRIGGVTSYFLAGIDIDFLHDESLDIYTCMDEVYSTQELVEVLQNMNISYISLDYTYAIAADAGDAIGERYASLYKFGKENFETVVEEGDYILFKALEAT